MPTSKKSPSGTGAQLMAPASSIGCVMEIVAAAAALGKEFIDRGIARGMASIEILGVPYALSDRRQSDFIAFERKHYRAAVRHTQSFSHHFRKHQTTILRHSGIERLPHFPLLQFIEA